MSASDFGITEGYAAPFTSKIDNSPIMSIRSPNQSLNDQEHLMFLKNLTAELIKRGVLDLSCEIHPDGVLVEAYLK